jgi:membrane protein insertase Oxa1/YidC/SpoIIIJ|tara:strand:- start:318 stop:560 length:243 start_codon:yes stop_codon:yes gene_type:complete
MEITAMLFWNILLTLVIAPALIAFRTMQQEVKRIDILVARTREEYTTKEDMRDAQDRIMTLLRRLEDKLDLMLSTKGAGE